MQRKSSLKTTSILAGARAALSPGVCRGPSAALLPAPPNSPNFPNSPPLSAPLPAANAECPLLAPLPPPPSSASRRRPYLGLREGRWAAGSSSRWARRRAAPWPGPLRAAPRCSAPPRGEFGGGKVVFPARSTSGLRSGGERGRRDGREGRTARLLPAPGPPPAGRGSAQGARQPESDSAALCPLPCAGAEGGAVHLAHPGVCGQGEENCKGAGEGRSGGVVLSTPLISFKLTLTVHGDLIWCLSSEIWRLLFIVIRIRAPTFSAKTPAKGR